MPSGCAPSACAAWRRTIAAFFIKNIADLNMKNLYRPMRTTLAAAMLIGGVMAAAPAQAQFEWMQKVAGVLNPRMAKLGEYNRLMSMHDYPAAATIAEALVEEDLKASHSLMNSLNLNNSALQQSAGMAAQAQAKAKNYPRAIELLQMQIDAMPAILRRARSEEHTSELQSHHDIVC